MNKEEIIKEILIKHFAPNGFKKVYLGREIIVSASQFVYESSITKAVDEILQSLEGEEKICNCETGNYCELCGLLKD